MLLTTSDIRITTFKNYFCICLFSPISHTTQSSTSEFKNNYLLHTVAQYFEVKTNSFLPFVTSSFGTTCGAETNESVQSNLICRNSTASPM